MIPAPRSGTSIPSYPTGEEALSTVLVPLALDAPIGVHNPNGMTYSVVSLGSDQYRVSLTGDGSTRDGSSEGVLLRFDVEDANGEAVDLTTGTYLVRVRVTIISATILESLIVVAGVKSQGSAAAGGLPRFGGFVTGAAVDRCTINSATSNASAAAAAMASITVDQFPIYQAVGTYQIGTTIVSTFGATGTLISSTELATATDATPGTCEIHVMLGFDAAHTNVKTSDVKIEALAILVRE